MNSAAKAGPANIATRSDNFHRWRSRKDLLAKRLIGLGGLVVKADKKVDKKYKKIIKQLIQQV